MKKDAYFFPRFCNARHDRKLKRVIKELQVEGYGIYFMLLEVLREQTDFKFPLSDIDLLADEFGTSEQKVRTVISNYGLFDVDEEQRFFSMKLVFYLQPYIEKTERARLAANKRWSNTKQLQQPDAKAYANALQMECASNAQAMQGEEKKGEVGEKRRVFKPPTLEEISAYTLAKGYCVDPKRFYEYFEAGDWHDSQGKPVKNWKQKLVTWNTKEQQRKGTNKQTQPTVYQQPYHYED